MSHNSAIIDDGARLDVAMYIFGGGCFEAAFVKLMSGCSTHAAAQLNHRSPLTSVYR